MVPGLVVEMTSDRKTIMTSDTYSAVYDFSLMPYALGDVLTWNIHSAIRSEMLGRKKVDVYICLDERSPANLHQRDFASAENCGLLFNELFGAFGTHPQPGNVHFFRRREEMRQRLRELADADSAIARPIVEYEHAVDLFEDVETQNRYLVENAYSHDAINAFHTEKGRIPLLRTSMGYGPDVEGLLARRLAGKRVVTFHMRNRRLDAGYGGKFSYSRDSDFLEWYEFLSEAGRKHPDVQFVALGRIQEKPLELLNLPNVVSLRAWGLGLGHELTLILRSDLFIGASSGFAAMAYFSEIPYFITRMTREACKAYCVEFEAERFPFGTERQFLVYEPETREMLMRILEQGLASVPPRNDASGPNLYRPIDVRSWEWERSRWLYPGATSYRFFNDSSFADKETAFLLWPHVLQAQSEFRRGNSDRAWTILQRIEANFQRVSERFAEFLQLKMAIASARNDVQLVESCNAGLKRISSEDRRSGNWTEAAARLLAREFPAALRLGHYWKRKHRVPEKLAAFIRHAWNRKHRIPHKILDFVNRLATPPKNP